MNKREYCESRESIAYYSGLNGLEIKGIENGIDDYVYCVSGAWGGGVWEWVQPLSYNMQFTPVNSVRKAVKACI